MDCKYISIKCEHLERLKVWHYFSDTLRVTCLWFKSEQRKWGEMVPYKLSGYSYTKDSREVFLQKKSSENISVLSTACIYIILFQRCTSRGQVIWYIFGVLRPDIIRE